MDKSEKTSLLQIAASARRLTSPSFPHGDHLEGPDGKKPRSLSYQALGGRHLRGSFERSRMRTNSLAVFNDLEDSIISTVGTSYGPVVVIDEAIPGYGGAIGLLLAAFSGILFTVNNFLFQYFSLNVSDMLLARSGMQTAVLGLILVVTGCNNILPVRCMDWFLVAGQSISSGARVGLTFACLEYLPIGDALTIIFSEPLWTLVLSKIFLKTRIGWWKFTFAFVLISGVILCTQPPFLFPSPDETQHRHHHHHGKHRHHHELSVAPDDSISNETLTRKTDVDDGCGYYMGVVLAVGAAVTGAASNVIVAKIEKISSTAIVTYRQE
jgi:drug/metabolite transporter (DMT)-like permease